MDGSPCGAVRPAVRLQRAVGALELSARAVDGATRLVHLYQASPCRALFPRPESDVQLDAILVNTGGGLVEGDRLDFKIRTETDARLRIRSQAAEKAYRSLTETSKIDVTLTAQAASLIQWVPEETILFDGARLERRIAADLAPDARLLAVETILFGRRARGESFTHGRLHESWRIRIAGRLVWADVIRLDGDVDHQRQRRFAFGDAAGYTSLVYAGPDAVTLLKPAQEIAASLPSRTGATLVNNVLLMRSLDPDEARLRASAASLTRAFAGELR
jgi:urease accessory protein